LSFTLPKIAGAAVLALATSALAVPLAATAHAAGAPVETEYFIAETDGDANFAYELWKRTTPTGTAVKVAGDTTHDLSDLSFSQDGSRLSYLQTTLDSYGDPVSTQVVVRDVAGPLVRVVSSVLESSSENAAPALSPDGRTVVWSNVSAGGLRLYRASVVSGTAGLVSSGYFGGVFLDGSTLLARSTSTGAWATMTLGGAATATGVLPQGAFDPAVSPDGARLAWAEDTTADGAGASTSDLKAATLSVTGGVATLEPPAVVATGQENEAPSFSADGSTVYFTRYDGVLGNGDVWSAPTTPDVANPPAVTVATAGDEYDVAIGTTDDGTAPAAATLLPAVLNGSAATVRWTLPADADTSGVLITRKLGSTVQKNVFVPAPLSSYADSGLTLGATYTYEIVSVDRSDNRGVPANAGLTALLPAPRFADPTSTTSAKRSFPVTFAATAPSSVGYFVDYRSATSSTWTHWVANAAGRIRTFGVASTGGGVYSTTSTPGTSYVFRVQIKDVYGNATGWVSSGRAVVPFDQAKATFSGGTTVAYSTAYLGSFRQLKTTSSYAKVTVTGNRLQVIGLRCSRCGKFAIYAGSTKLATVDTYASSTKVRQVLYTKTYSTVASRTFTIRPLATSGRPAVDLDGFATRR
jgi:Tol biopolymer transport system component